MIFLVAHACFLQHTDLAFQLPPEISAGRQRFPAATEKRDLYSPAHLENAVYYGQPSCMRKRRTQGSFLPFIILRSLWQRHDTTAMSPPQSPLPSPSPLHSYSHSPCLLLLSPEEGDKHLSGASPSCIDVPRNAERDFVLAEAYAAD